MGTGQIRRPSGHVFRSSGAPDRPGTRSTGCRPGARCSASSGRRGPRAGAAGRLLHEATAEELLRRRLDEARRGTLPGTVRTGATFADARGRVHALHRAGPRAQAVDAAWLPLGRSHAHLLPAFGELPVEDDHDRATIEQWRAGFSWPGARAEQAPDHSCTGSSAGRARSTGCRATRRRRSRSFSQRSSGEIEVFSPEEVWALVRAAGVGAGRGDVPDARRSRGYAWASCWPCAGATSTSPASTIRVRASYCARRS